ncbi:hypothetical protein CYMTET_50869 [Cymbomonas tetramitiformis]|uniref:Uncharacterized protein n=1 Tax=Cymbomonas tetramitiformis TaxID=36881 RepID=A0AAE0ET02_9CHLO|nr:hypothetical protein CYMTET_50869 [Cymbomonas tetramitiformis]
MLNARLIKVLRPKTKSRTSGSRKRESEDTKLPAKRTKLPEIKTQPSISHIRKGARDETPADNKIREVLFLVTHHQDLAQLLIKDRNLDFGFPTRKGLLPSAAEKQALSQREVAVIDYSQQLFVGHRTRIVNAITKKLSELALQRKLPSYGEDSYLVFEKHLGTPRWAPSDSTVESLLQWKRNSNDTINFYAILTESAYDLLVSAGSTIVVDVHLNDNEATGEQIFVPVKLRLHAPKSSRLKRLRDTKTSPRESETSTPLTRTRDGLCVDTLVGLTNRLTKTPEEDMQEEASSEGGLRTWGAKSANTTSSKEEGSTQLSLRERVQYVATDPPEVRKAKYDQLVADREAEDQPYRGIPYQGRPQPKGGQAEKSKGLGVKKTGITKIPRKESRPAKPPAKRARGHGAPADIPMGGPSFRTVNHEENHPPVCKGNTDHTQARTPNTQSGRDTYTEQGVVADP